ncbi:uncharacterized protein LOC125777626 [Bactrocera dorsalis]|uniref:Uncharacterized protein LOC125777626 n=1 Tax=Bactrocera dorsalis TaxID=27457 RepID=A0ABM3JHE9_BACDO|nr:uncharacterized protein LOC125777626 [Bactrocera dorsalis]
MIDTVISAEIPDQTIDPGLFEVVTKNMIHGPCGGINRNSLCMIDGKCSKRFPQQLIAETITGDVGYPQYRRRSIEDNGKSTYVNKGSDMAVFGVAPENNHDEILQYQMGRYISTNEAVWRILSFPIHHRHPVVVHLAVHLENGQRVYYTAASAEQRVVEPPVSTLTAYFQLCETDEFSRTLLYSEVSHYFTWNASTKKFQRRKQGTPVDGYPGIFRTDATVSPANVECFYLRLLLVNVHGPQSLQHLRTVNGQLCATYREACQHLHLLEDDTHWDATLRDASIVSPPIQIRMLFAIIISAELQRELQFDRNELRAFVQTYTPQLNDQQKYVYDTVMQAVNDHTGGLYFLDAPGGTGKHF